MGGGFGPRDVALAGADGASAMRRRPRAGGGGAEPVPLEGGLGERPGLAEAVVGRLVEPGVERGRPSACPTAKPAAARPAAAMTWQAEALRWTASRPSSRPSSRQPARKSCRAAPSIAAMALSGVSAESLTDDVRRGLSQVGSLGWELRVTSDKRIGNYVSARYAPVPQHGSSTKTFSAASPSAMPRSSRNARSTRATM